MCLSKMKYIRRLFNLFINSITAELIFGIVIFINKNCVSCDENQNEYGNISESNFSYDELLRNDSNELSLFNQSRNSLNDSSIEFLGNLTDDSNQTKYDPVVTEDWGNSEKSELNRKYLSFTTPDEDICNCDLNSNICDINCCCDVDCNEEDIKVFSKCHSRALTPDKNYCYQKDIIFRNNTVYKMIKDPESSLFCIVHDNLKEHLRFKELPVLKSHRDLDVLLKYQSKHIPSWSADDDEIDKSGLREIRAGNPIYIDYVSAKSKFDSHWSLPSACFTRMCSCNQEIHYLEDFDSICSRTISSLKDECESNLALSAESFSNFCINSHSLSLEPPTHLSDLIAHTKVINLTTDYNLQSNKLCIERDMLKPKYSYRQNVCSNIVSAIHFTVTHNGFNGIQDIHVKLKYINITTNRINFLQHFSVNFEWYNVTDTIRRSGNPGYQVGFPLLVGTNSSIMELENSFEITVQPGGLTVLDRDANNLCSTERRTIKFGKNFKTSCVFKFVKLDCTSFQERIQHILLGSSQKQVFVGVFGNANNSNIDDWIEAYHEDREVLQDEETCSIITDLRINVAFAAVGTVVNPQFKILGVGYHYGKPQTVDLACLSSCPNLMLTTSVSFFDVTEPAIPHYPKVPSIKANLPSDFFYPFLYGKQSNCVSNVYLVLFMCSLFLFK